MVKNVVNTDNLVNILVNTDDFTEQARIHFHNDWTDFLRVYSEYLHKKRLNEDTIYEYLRLAQKFLKPLPSKITYKDTDLLKKRIAEFLNISNANTHRNSLACLRHLFRLLGLEDLIKTEKFRQIIPTFSIRTPSLEEIQIFYEALDDSKIKLYYHLATVSAIRPEHLLKLTKGLFDRRNNMINTFQKEYSQKNFYFSYYSDELKPSLEAYLDTLPTADTPLFNIGKRWLLKKFKKAKDKTGILITPKTLRKFATNWFRRHGMIPEDVDAITGHTPKSIVARHYLDCSRIKEEYDRATKDLKLIESKKEQDDWKEKAQKELGKTEEQIAQQWKDALKPFEASEPRHKTPLF